MKKRIYPYAVVCLLFLLNFTGCVYEHPELTADGELGIDPTEVTITADIILDMQITQTNSTRNTSEYRHRFIVDAYLGRDLARRIVLYADVTESNHLNIPVTMKLHARDYRLVVWADYVAAGSEDDLFYNTEELVSIMGTSPYRGNTEYKDVQTAAVMLELTEYRNQWNARVPVRVELTRPVARYTLVTTDVERYLKSRPDASGKRYSITVKYENYLPIGYNAYDGLPKHLYIYMNYSNAFTMPSVGTMEMPLSFDYIFVSDDIRAPQITIEVKDEKSIIISRTTGLTLNCEKDRATVVKGAFLTADDKPGVGVDPEFDGEKEIETIVTFI